MPNKNKKNRQGLFFVLAITILLFLAVSFLMRNPAAQGRDKYSEILRLFDENRVENFNLDLGTQEIEITLKEGEVFESEIPQVTQTPFSALFGGEQEKEEKNQVIYYKVPNVSLFLDNIDTAVREHNMKNPDDNVSYDYEPIKQPSIFLQMLPNLILIGLMLALWFFMMRQSGMGGSQMDKFTQTKAKKHEEKSKTTFNDVAGADEEKAELEEIVEFLKNPKKYNALGARIPKGVLLIGPPGTGKTLLARAVAGEAGVPFFSISGSDFVEMFVGVGAKRVRDLFEGAKKERPSIVFIDEIDAVGRQRGAGLGGGHDEREQTLNQLLVEMDGFGDNEGVIVIAATNRSDVLDPALLRAGRFDRQVTVQPPDVRGREEILKIHTRNKPLAPDVNLADIAKTSVGFTGADLENLANEAALLAARHGKQAISKVEIEEATIKVVMGAEKTSLVVDEKSRKITAYHEAGHAVTSYYLPTQDPVHQVSIIPRTGGAGGYTMYLPEKDSLYMMRNQMYENLVSMFGGRVAEQIILDDISTGASSDISRATKIARAMVTKYGFSDELGALEYGSEGNQEVFMGRDFGQTRGYSEEIAAKIDNEVRKIVDKAYAQATEILTTHIDKLHQVANELFDKEKIDGAEFIKLMESEAIYRPVEKTEDIATEDTGFEVENGSEEAEKS